MEIGAQFFTLRDLCKTPEGLADCLARVADIGYKNVQISGVCPYEPAWLKDQLQKNGLKCVLTHIPPQRIAEETDQVIADHEVFDCDHIGLGYWAFDEKRDQQTFERFMELFPAAAHRIHQAGKLFMYHNHDQEFKRLDDGKIILEHLMEAVPAEEMGFTLDTFWVQAGGGDPAQWLERLAGRIPCIHLKDFAYGRKMAVVGEGNINFDRVFAKAEAGGTQYMLVEQDDCNGEDPLACLARSYAYLHAYGFE